MSQIRIDNEMLNAFKTGCKQYQPLCDGIKLEPECGDPASTTRNLHNIVSSSPQRSILAILNSGDSGVLIVLKTGETYLATGYSIGSNGPGTVALARFLIEHNDGDWREDFDEMFELLASWPADLAGPVSIPSG
jgi:hypothetical protein